MRCDSQHPAVLEPPATRQSGVAARLACSVSCAVRRAQTDGSRVTGFVRLGKHSSPGGEPESGAAALSGDRRECWNESVSNDVRAEAMPARAEAVWAASGALTVALFASGLLFGDL